MSRLELTIKDKHMEKNSPFVADFGCNRQIWISFNDCDDICDPKSVTFKTIQEFPTVSLDFSTDRLLGCYRVAANTFKTDGSDRKRFEQSPSTIHRSCTSACSGTIEILMTVCTPTQVSTFVVRATLP